MKKKVNKKQSKKATKTSKEVADESGFGLAFKLIMMQANPQSTIRNMSDDIKDNLELFDKELVRFRTNIRALRNITAINLINLNNINETMEEIVNQPKKDV